MGERPLEGRTPARDVTDDAGQRELGEFGGRYAARRSDGFIHACMRHGQTTVRIRWH
jgi:hypothetical protein